MITFDSLLELMPIVARRVFKENTDLVRLNRVRDMRRACPICALVNEIDPHLDFRGAAGLAMDRLLGRPLEPGEAIAVRRVVVAADLDIASTKADRKRLMQALEMQA